MLFKTRQYTEFAVRFHIFVQSVPEAAVLRDEAEGAAEAEGADDEAAAVGGTIEATPPALFRPIARLLTGPRLA